MTEEPIVAEVSIMEVLATLGFIEKLDRPGTLTWNFGNGEVSATEGVGYSGRCVGLYGSYRTERTFGEIDAQLPSKVESVEQGVAWVAHSIGNAELAQRPSWMDDGRRWRDQLPWLKRSSNEATLASCNVKREWFRLALNKLRILSKGAVPERVMFEFDGKTLTIHPQSFEPMIMAAGGVAWEQPYAVSLEVFGELRVRLPDLVFLTVVEDWLCIDGKRLPLEKPKETP